MPTSIDILQFFLVTLLLMLMPACCIITTLPKEKQISEADVSQKFFRLYLAIRFHMCFRCRPYKTRCKGGGRCCILAKGSSTLSLSHPHTHTQTLSLSPTFFISGPFPAKFIDRFCKAGGPTQTLTYPLTTQSLQHGSL